MVFYCSVNKLEKDFFKTEFRVNIQNKRECKNEDQDNRKVDLSSISLLNLERS